MVFVTGGTGLLGSHLICELLKSGKSVKALKRSNSSMTWFNRVAIHLLKDEWTSCSQRLTWVDGDVLDIISLIDAIEGCDSVYHAAAMVSFAKKDKDQLLKINVNGTANVINACLSMTQRPKLCYISSTASIGRVEKKTLDESIAYSEESSNSFYSYTKYLAELEAYRGREEGLDVAIINPCIILGFGNWNQGSVKFFKNGKSGFPFYTGGSNAFVDASDVARASIVLMEQECFEERYLCVGWNLKYYNVFAQIAKEFGTKPPRILVRPWMAEFLWRIIGFYNFIAGTGIITKESARAGLRDTKYSSQKLIDKTGFAFTSFEDSVTNACDGYKTII